MAIIKFEWTWLNLSFNILRKLTFQFDNKNGRSSISVWFNTASVKTLVRVGEKVQRWARSSFAPKLKHGSLFPLVLISGNEPYVTFPAALRVTMRLFRLRVPDEERTASEGQGEGHIFGFYLLTSQIDCEVFISVRRGGCWQRSRRRRAVPSR